MKRPSTRAWTAVMLLAVLPAGAGVCAAEGFPEVVERVKAGTVMIEARGRSEVHYGTGFFLESPAMVVTALHVVSGARSIKVAIPETFLTSDAFLVSGSAEWDVALLRVSWPEGVGYPGLTLSEGDRPLRVGADVAFTGYGYGVDPSFSKVLSTYRGIVSSLVPHGDDHLIHLGSFVTLGLSGSPLYLPDTGEVVGVVTRHFGPPELGFGYGGAVPAGVVKRLAEGVAGRKPVTGSPGPKEGGVGADLRLSHPLP